MKYIFLTFLIIAILFLLCSAKKDKFEDLHEQEYMIPESIIEFLDTNDAEVFEQHKDLS
jgi:hypothetical protein